MGAGSAGGSAVEGGQPEQERHHWLLRGGGWRKAVAVTNCVGAARAQSIFVRAAK